MVQWKWLQRSSDVKWVVGLGKINSVSYTCRTRHNFLYSYSLRKRRPCELSFCNPAPWRWFLHFGFTAHVVLWIFTWCKLTHLGYTEFSFLAECVWRGLRQSKLGTTDSSSWGIVSRRWPGVLQKIQTKILIISI